MTESSAIGGFFEPGTAAGPGLPWLAGAQGFVSARAAIQAVLAAAGARTVWAPAYACAALHEAIEAAGARCLPYALDASFAPGDFSPAGEDWVVCVDYFGVAGTAVEQSLRRFPADRLLIDASQSFYRQPRGGATFVYSPRKFAGLPDGGWLVTPHAVPAPAPADEAASIERGAAGRLRREGKLEEGFARYQAAERSLEGLAPQAMSEHTRRLSSLIDYPAAAERRRTNFALLACLAARLGLQPRFTLGEQVPLCLPLGCAPAESVRAHLARHRIYTPRYWPGIAVGNDDGARLLLRETLFLPIDQRYGEAEMQRIAVRLEEALHA